ncbi:MFS family permease [Labrenzia sp. EL_159]|nr:MFS family permease [Labrenzia sp. EL_162]MBG6194456.1 MFS family permease [Labrenzia sp. EL_159]
MSDDRLFKQRPLWMDAVAVALLMTATFKIMANATISPALPALEASFADVPGADYLVRFLVSAPSLTVVLVAPIAGLIADRHGRGPLLIAGVTLFAIAGSAGAYLPDLNSILVSRLLLGVAVAMTMTAQVSLVGDLFTGERRSSFLGWQTATVNFSGFIFIGFAGYLAGLSPRLPFLIYAIPILLLPLLVSIGHREKHAGEGVEGVPASSTEVTPSQRWVIQALMVAALAMTTVSLFFLMPSQLPFYLDRSGFESASATAVALGTLTLVGGCVALIFKRVCSRLGLALTLSVGYLVMGGGFVALAVEATWVFILAGAALIGAGYAFVQPGFLLLALKVAPPERRGTVSGFVTTGMFLGQVISPIVMTPFLQIEGFGAVFFGVALVLMLLAVLSLLPEFLRLEKQSGAT